FLKTRNKPPMFLVCQDWVPEPLRPFADEAIGRLGLRPSVSIIGMSAEDVLPPVRPLPRLEYKVVSDLNTRNRLPHINSYAYGFPVEYGREAFTEREIWDHCRGYVAWHNGSPVATAAVSTLPGSLAGSLYVGFVATMPEAQRQGFAEAVMRHALAEQLRATG